MDIVKLRWAAARVRVRGNVASVIMELRREFIWASGDRVASFFAMGAAVHIFAISSIGAVAVLLVVKDTMVKLRTLWWR